MIKFGFIIRLKAGEERFSWTPSWRSPGRPTTLSTYLQCDGVLFFLADFQWTNTVELILTERLRRHSVHPWEHTLQMTSLGKVSENVWQHGANRNGAGSRWPAGADHTFSWEISLLVYLCTNVQLLRYLYFTRAEARSFSPPLRHRQAAFRRLVYMFPKKI